MEDGRPRSIVKKYEGDERDADKERAQILDL
jgi:hypothetical protein